jgi:hypothetical protein
VFVAVVCVVFVLLFYQWNDTQLSCVFKKNKTIRRIHVDWLLIVSFLNRLAINSLTQVSSTSILLFKPGTSDGTEARYEKREMYAVQVLAKNNRCWGHEMDRYENR